jgi:hypothetical protein
LIKMLFITLYVWISYESSWFKLILF